MTRNKKLASLAAAVGMLSSTVMTNAALISTSDFTQADFENGSTTMAGDYTAGGTGNFTLNSGNEGTWILGNINGINNAYTLSDTDYAGNTTIHMSPLIGNLRGFVQHADAGVDKWTGTTTFTIDYVADASSANQFFTFAAFAWNDGDSAPVIDVHDTSTLLYDHDTDTYEGLENQVYQTAPTLSAETTRLITTNQLSANPWNTASFSLNLGATGYDNVGVLIATEGGEMLFDNLTASTVPEPSAAALLGLGGLALILRRRRKVNSSQ